MGVAKSLLGIVTLKDCSIKCENLRAGMNIMDKITINLSGPLPTLVCLPTKG